MLIGEVSRRSGVSARMLRHYESLGLLKPSGRTTGGYREYTGDDIRRIFHIESLRSLGLSLREVASALDDPGFKPSSLVDDLIRQTRDRIAAETELLTRLSRISATEPAEWDDVLHMVALLQALNSESAGKRQRAALSPFPVPPDALAEAALNEADPNVAGALRWALAQTGKAALPRLAEGLDSPDADVRKRAVQSIAEIPNTNALLQDALTNPDITVRRQAALTLGARGVPEAIPTLIDMILEATNDADAADALSAVAATPTQADRIAETLTTHLTAEPHDHPTRLRLLQALADIPGPKATATLKALTTDKTRPIALTATHLLTLRARP
ncbi:HEAT repeat domain-containing protein [Actinomadura rupiterrae]|uniref:HEAT repeat domain-containing protein n=1 Tax=Actinomadura rupiterrae TaxID=559627 RepID=UPI0020A5B0D9|nr:HEAT repeat domain-containing protein [Actinomadura rupiterrae]MCP2342510.1 DNA-binding transcriptional MerR regulator [Actinomadura rupiterrae]